MPRRKRSKKWISWVVIAILLVIAGVVVYFVWDGYFRDKGDKTAGEDTSDKSSIVDDNTNKSESATDTAEESLDMGVTDDDVLVNPTNEYENLTGVITYAGVSGLEFLVRTSIDQYLTDGTCELTILQGGEVVYAASAAILPDVSTSVCDGFNVAVGDLPDGELDIVIEMSSGDKTGVLKRGATL